MLEERFRYSAHCCVMIPPSGPSTWHVMDWDRRRMTAVATDGWQEDENLAVEHFKKHIDILPPDVYKIHVSDSGDLLAFSTDPKEDLWVDMHRHAVEELQVPQHFDIETVVRTELRELSRIAPNIDLVSYGAGQKKVVFKYYLIWQFEQQFWNELNIWIRLPRHPNIVPFDRIVVDEMKGGIVGFTSLYIPGGTLDENPSRVFKLKWLKQLMQVVDDLNLKHGLIHHDIAARNLLIDPETDNLLLFDFNLTHCIGGPGYGSNSDISGIDVTLVIFTVYGIITGDKRFQFIRFDELKTEDVEELEAWVPGPGVTLDSPVPVYRSALHEWAQRRRQAKRITVYTETPEYIDWPELVCPKPTIEVDERGISIVTNSPNPMRFTEREAGRPTLNWERPPEIGLRDGT